MSVLVLGAGKMVESILVGIKKTQSLSGWQIYSPSGKSALALATKVGARALSDLASAKNPEWVLVGCKPQQLKELKLTLNGLFKDSLYVSLLAAVTEADQRDILGVKKLIRIMPNLAVKINQGVSLLASTSAVNELESFNLIFSKLGVSKIVSEAELEELTILTGSAPALFYEFARKLADSFTSLDHHERELLIRQVLKGSGDLIYEDDKPLISHIEAVTSKGGVTIAVLEKWRDLEMGDLLKAGVRHGQQRTQEIKALLRQN